MRPITKSALNFLLGFIVVLLVSAILSPFLFKILPFKFDRILRRLIMIGALIQVAWLMKDRRDTFKQMGLQWNGKFSFNQWVKGFGFGVFLVMSITLLQWAIGARMFQLYETDPGRWIGLVFKALGAGILIGLLEEFFFRGFLYGFLKDLWNKPVSLIVTNLVYALVHFFPKGKVFVGPDPTIYDSFRIYKAAIMPGTAAFIQILPAVAGLFLFGMILSFQFLEKKSLYPPIGIHSGAVFGLKMNRRFFPEIAEKMTLWSGHQVLYDGWAGIGFLAVMTFLMSPFVRRKQFLKTSVLVFGIYGASGILPALAAESLTPGVTYSFLERLPEAETWRKISDEEFEGKWARDRFKYKGLPGLADIFVTDNAIVQDKKRKGIWIHPLHESKTTLIYRKVVLGRQLHVFYGLPDYSFESEESVVPVHLVIKIGKKTIFDTHLNSKGWVSKTFSLTLPRLLERNFQVTFEITSSDAKRNPLILFAYTD